MDSAVVLGIGGLVTTLLGSAGVPVYVALRADERARARAREGALTDVLEDGLRHAQFVAGRVERITDIVSRWTHSPDSRADDARPVVEVVSARMWLHAPEGVRAAWLALLSAEESLIWEMTEGDSAHTLTESTFEVPSDLPQVVAVVSAVAEFRRHARGAVGTPN